MVLDAQLEVTRHGVDRWRDEQLLHERPRSDVLSV
jgi:hypothetical protein